MTPPPLIGGPYSAPPGDVGGFLTCLAVRDGLRRGRVPISGFTDGPIRWPFTMAYSSKPSLILCGDLVTAVRAESAQAVAHWWGVERGTVTDWRKALGVGRMTQGTTAIWRETAKTKLARKPSRFRGEDA